MVRHHKKTVAKLQQIVLLVKSVDRENWTPEKKKIGGFLDEKPSNNAKSENPQKKIKSASSDKPIEPSPVTKGTEYPHLLGQKVHKPAPVHEGPVRFYNFQEEAYNQLNAAAKKDVDARRNKSGSSSASAMASSSSSYSSSSCSSYSSVSSGGAIFSSSSTSMKSQSKEINENDRLSGTAFGTASSSSSSSSSGVSSFLSSSSSMKAQSKNDDDSEAEDDPRSCYSRGFEALDEEEEQVFNQEEEESCLVASILLAMRNSMDIGLGQVSNLAAPKENGGSVKRSRDHRGPFWIPQYHSDSLSDDQEGVDSNTYNMSVLQIDESLFGRQKYHKGRLLTYSLLTAYHTSVLIVLCLILSFTLLQGHPVKGSWVVAVRDQHGKIRAEVVADRGTVRLTRFIETYVRPGAYHSFANSLNHSLTFFHSLTHSLTH